LDRTLNGNLPADLDHPFGGQSKIVRLVPLVEEGPIPAVDGVVRWREV
jgi:hypothetical protein